MILSYTVHNGWGDSIYLVIQGKDQKEIDTLANQKIEEINNAKNKRFPMVDDPKYRDFTVVQQMSDKNFLCVDYIDHELGDMQ